MSSLDAWTCFAHPQIPPSLCLHRSQWLEKKQTATKPRKRRAMEVPADEITLDGEYNETDEDDSDEEVRSPPRALTTTK